MFESGVDAQAVSVALKAILGSWATAVILSGGGPASQAVRLGALTDADLRELLNLLAPTAEVEISPSEVRFEKVIDGITLKIVVPG